MTLLLAILLTTAAMQVVFLSVAMLRRLRDLERDRDFWRTLYLQSEDAPLSEDILPRIESIKLELERLVSK